MGIVTKKGDDGMTGLATGERVSKSDPRVEALGTLDELVSFLGVVRSMDLDETIAKYIYQIQSDLFSLGAEFAKSDKATVGEKQLKWVEDLIDEYEPSIHKPAGFVIPGDSAMSAHIDVARSVCRRLERKAVGLKEAGFHRGEVAIKYINRLADLLYIFARHV